MRAFEALWKLLFVFGTDCAQWAGTTDIYLEKSSNLICISRTNSYQDPGQPTWAQPVWGPKSPGLQGTVSLQSAPKVPLLLERAEEVPLGLTPRGNGTCTTVSQCTVHSRALLETPLGEHLLKCHHSYQSVRLLLPGELEHLSRKQSPRICYLQCTIARRSEVGRDDSSTHPTQNHHRLLSIYPEFVFGTFQQRRLYHLCLTSTQAIRWLCAWWSYDCGSSLSVENIKSEDIRSCTITCHGMR